MVVWCCLTTSLATGFNEESYAPICNGLKDNGRAIGHPKDTQAYWVCEDGRVTPRQCIGRDRFNSKLSKCEHPLFSSMIRNSPTDENTFKCPASGLHRFVLEGSCTNYILCLGSRYSIQSCARDLHFDGVLLGCNYKDKAKCDRDWCPLTNSGNTIVTRPSTTSCNELVFLNIN